MSDRSVAPIAPQESKASSFPLRADCGLFASTWVFMGGVAVMVGRVLGAVAGKRAEVIGGLLLIGIGAAILVEHLRAA
jgi:putative Mn2+ efflux pump MntP